MKVKTLDEKIVARIKILLFLLCLLPLGKLVAFGIIGKLGANPIEKIARTTGYWTLTLLLVTLTATPLRRLSGWLWVMRLRRMLGLFAFFYASLHFLTYLVLDQFFDWSGIVKDIVKRPYITVGFPAFLLLIPLALTSTNAMQRRLGGRRWRLLHRLVYVVAVGGVVHYWWLVKKDITNPATFAVLLGLLFAVRLVYWARNAAVKIRVSPQFSGYNETAVNEPFCCQQRSKRLALTAAAVLLVGFAIVAAGGYWYVAHTVPQAGGAAAVPGLSASTRVIYDRYGIPAISTANRNDAFRALGYVIARDRLFQMDLMRRKSAGRLAEVFGRAALENDRRARTLGFSRTAGEAAAKLPPQYRQQLSAYADGVNAFIEGADPLPYEFGVLSYRPDPWRIEDSYLAILGMFDLLTSPAEDEERMLTTMEQCLPQDVAAFLTPDTDRYTDSLLAPGESRRPAKPVPVASLAALHASSPAADAQDATLVAMSDAAIGSNAWAVGGAKTADGRAILANDMHLGLSVPNVWYRVEMHIGRQSVAGIVLPGVPAIVVGSNGHIAWGATNLSGDFIDLVQLEANNANPEEYRTPAGWHRFEATAEIIRVKGEEPVVLPVKRTIWGPVAERRLLGVPVAVHWTALDTETHSGAMFDVDRVESLQDGLELFNRAGGPPLNMLLADDQGHIAWTMTGKIPKRFGFDGSVSRSWAGGRNGWDGYVDGRELPRSIDPPQGFLVSANDRRVGNEFPYIIGRQFAGGYRAYRAAQVLAQMRQVSEERLLALQLDLDTEFYRFYQRLALAAISAEALAQHPELRGIRAYLEAWDGTAATGAKGLPLLVHFRAALAENLFAPFLATCRAADPDFKYHWTFIDTPLQAILSEKLPQLLPGRGRYKHWDDFIVQQLLRGARQLQAQFPESPLLDLTWGPTDKAQIRHPFSQAFPWLGPLLDMPEDELPGCLECLRVASPHFGASERLVVSPAHLEQGILHMPGGQASNPLSPNYRDQHVFWVGGEPLSLLSGKRVHSLLLHP